MATRPPVVVIVGETGSGKSALAMELAQKFNGEIICADSRTVYVGMDIGTAKPSLKDQQKVRHFGLNITTPVTPVNVAEFKRLATEAIAEIAARGHLPIIVGGSGLYVDSILFNYRFSEPTTNHDEQNPRHLKQANQTDRQKMRPTTLVVALEIERDELKARIAHRLDEMLKAGLETEAKSLSERYGWELEPLKTIGYREWRSYFEGQASLEQVKVEIIKDTMAYAKRQRTWFKRNKSIHWLKKQSEAVDLVTTFLNKQHIVIRTSLLQ